MTLRGMDSRDTDIEDMDSANMDSASTDFVAARLARRLAIAGALVALCAMMLASPDAASAQTIAIRGAQVHTEPGKVLDGATVVIRDGVVRSVARGGAVPAGATIIDGTGKVVTAGLIDASTRVGLVEVSLERSTAEGGFPSSGDDGDDVIHAAYRVSEGYHAGSVAIPIGRAQGVTSVVSVPSGGLVSGTSGWFALADGLTPDVTVRAPLAMYANLGEASLGSAKGSRGMALLRLRELLDDSRVYSRTRRNYERNQSRRFIAGAGRLDLEAMIPVIQGQLPLVVRAHRSSDILAAVKLAREQRLRLVVEGGAEAWMVAKELAAARVGVIMSPEANLPDRFEQIQVRDDGAKILSDAGVTVVISAIGGPRNLVILRQLAGMAVANGMTHEQALAAITTAPAALFGVPRGTIAAGRVADLVVWSGDPFELSTRAEHVIIAGKEQPLHTRQTLLRDRYRTLGGAAGASEK